MPGIEPLIYQQKRPIRILSTLLQNGTLPHALLFTGTEGVGKQAAAVAMAMACNCQAETSGHRTEDRSDQDRVKPPHTSGLLSIGSCGVCKACKKIASGKHPDIIQIKPSGVSIRIAQVRELVYTLAMKPYEAKTRVVIISEASAMNAASSNALLKILEEPPDRTVLVLAATHKSDLLPTIVSRCQHIGFNPISKKNLALLLNEKYEIQPPADGILAAMAKGSLSKAQLMIKDNWLQHRSWVLNEMRTLSLQPIARLLALAEKISTDRKVASDSLEIIKSWFRDLIMTRYDPGKIINQDAADEIEHASQQMDIRNLLTKIDAVQKAQNRLTPNTNLRLFMEGLLIQLAQT